MEQQHKYIKRVKVFFYAVFNLAHNMQSWPLQRCCISSGIAENIRPFTWQAPERKFKQADQEAESRHR